MALLIRCGGCFHVSWHGEDLGPAPSGAAGAALLFLARTPGSWVNRSELARRLFASPRSGARANSLRQTLYLMRGWLPGAALETTHLQVRITAACRVDLTMPSGQVAVGLQIAPLLEHPWLGEFRASRSVVPGPPPEHPVHLFGKLVLALADLDAEAARQALVSSPVLVSGLSSSVLADLLGKTRPQSGDDPYAFEYQEIKSIAAMRAGQMRVALKCTLRAFQIAKRARNFEAMARASALAMFHRLEMGDMPGAREWLSTVISCDRAAATRLLSMNAKAALFWNGGNLAEGLATMRAAGVHAALASREERMRYYANLSLLEAEADDYQAVAATVELGRSLAVPLLDVAPILILDLAEAEVFIRISEPAKAQVILHKALVDARASESKVGEWYVREAMAEALSMQDRKAGQRMWAQVERERLDSCDSLTPRVQARRRRVITSVKVP